MVVNKLFSRCNEKLTILQTRMMMVYNTILNVYLIEFFIE